VSVLIQINNHIKKEIPKLTVPSAVHMVKQHLTKIYPDKSAKELYGHLNFSANSSLSFPKSEISDIHFIEFQGRVEVNIELNFLNLFGSATPLPIHYAEEVREDWAEEATLLDFLNLFNHNLQKFIYPIWRDARYHVSYQKDLKDHFSKYLLSILGLYPQSQQKDTVLNFHKLLPFLGMLSLKQKSSGTLASIMRHYIGHKSIGIEECILSRATVPEWQKKKLGEEETILGESLICGDFVTVSNLKFRINLYDIPWHYLKDYSLFGDKLEPLKDLVSFTLNEPLGFELCLHIKQTEVKSFKLGDPNFLLGINSWTSFPIGTTQITIEP